MSKGMVLLSFDVEEFDMPLEYDQHISLQKQLAIGLQGFEVCMEILNSAQVPATLFTTANFANEFRTQMQSLSAAHEIASHTYYHSSFKNEDLLQSRLVLEEVCGKPVVGFRMPRMKPVDIAALKHAGYQYDSSINPTYIPGRYNNFNLPRTIYEDNGIVRLPASVTPNIRVPLFWLTFKNFPYKLFLYWVTQVLKKDGYVCLYFHPWEFVDLASIKIPSYTKRLAGEGLQNRLVRLLNDLKQDYTFSTIQQYLHTYDLKYSQ